ncbi:MaoC family dehydratase [Blastococcus saxobsidens]|uniref:MaoC-like dehydratase n=1 Tax=Blastococcus saxobsidens (strain DD2) TaxID=1146883 RepID=H6RSY4_BLASD|nr:MaoC family dehydratase [Blastococcus saxobsidens]CCG04287.1 MaoC-like dehydratase [Blastococcus saxobsidens DD2]
MTANETLEIESLEIHLTQERMNAFGDAAGSAGRVHTDPEWAEPVFGSTLAQGMLVLDPVVQMMVGVCGSDNWFEGGRVKAKFVGMTRPGDTVVARMKDVEVVEEEGRKRVRGSFSCETQAGVVVIVGEAEGPLPQ